MGHSAALELPFHDEVIRPACPPNGGRVFNANDISLGDDGFGNACFILPDGEMITLAGIAPHEVSMADLHAVLGAPNPFAEDIPTPEASNPAEVENILCFTPGTMILTQQGERAIETLSVGDLVVTRDQGLRPIRWIGSRTLAGRPQYAPVRIQGAGTAAEGLLVSPQHRILYTGYRAELLFGASEVLIAAADLIDGETVTQLSCDTVTYIHLMFDHHEVIYADGVAAESFHASDEALDALDPASRAALFAVVPQMRSTPACHLETARPCLKTHEAALLVDDAHSGPFA